MNIDNIIRRIINETNERYDNWSKTFMSYANQMIQELQQEYLKKLGLSIKLNTDYNFGNRKWFAAYEKSSRTIEQGIIQIAINLPYLYSEMKNRGIENDNFNIAAQARITIGHEIGHGIIDYLLSCYEEENEAVDQFIHDMYEGIITEEEAVEEFGETMFTKATGRYTCDLTELLDKL